jgi:hypothetical protein
MGFGKGWQFAGLLTPHRRSPPGQHIVSLCSVQLIRAAVDAPLYELGKPWTPIELPVENYTFLPCWFTCAFAFRGVQGYWAVKPPAAVGHPFAH